VDDPVERFVERLDQRLELRCVGDVEPVGDDSGCAARRAAIPRGGVDLLVVGEVPLDQAEADSAARSNDENTLHDRTAPHG
jgi:hypothetical protein